MVERLLLHAISNFKDLAPKKKQLYVTESYVSGLGLTSSCEASTFDS